MKKPENLEHFPAKSLLDTTFIKRFYLSKRTCKYMKIFKNCRLLKIAIYMKFICILCIATTLQAIAVEGYTQNATVNIRLQEAKVEKILQEIENQSEYRFFYDAERIRFPKQADVDWNSVKVSDALADLFGKQGIAYRLIDKQIVLFPVDIDKVLSLQGVLITGTVTDADRKSVV